MQRCPGADQARHACRLQHTEKSTQKKPPGGRLAILGLLDTWANVGQQLVRLSISRLLSPSKSPLCNQ